MDIKDKINDRIDKLESALSSGDHLKSVDGVVAVLDGISSVSKFASMLSDEERDFINAAKTAVAERKEWK